MTVCLKTIAIRINKARVYHKPELNNSGEAFLKEKCLKQNKTKR